MDRSVAQAVVARTVGSRPRTGTEAADLRPQCVAEVLHHAPSRHHVYLRSPAQVRSLLARDRIEFSGTRAWRLTALPGRHVSSMLFSAGAKPHAIEPRKDRGGRLVSRTEP